VSKAGAGIVMGHGVSAWLARIKGIVRRRDDLLSDRIAEQALGTHSFGRPPHQRGAGIRAR